MNLADLVPDPEVLIALEPDELGLRMLPALASWPRSEQFTLANSVTGPATARRPLKTKVTVV